MYSKFFFSVVLFLFVIAIKVSSGNESENTSRQTKSYSTKDVVTPVHPANDNNATTLALEFPKDYSSNHQNNHPGDDDAQTHYFHFNRLNRRRWKALLCFAAKIILLITHLCSFFSAFIHLTQ
jgi:hypothetical protein